MNKSLRRRVAAVATTATVGGLLLPFLAAGSALAAGGATTAGFGVRGAFKETKQLQHRFVPLVSDSAKVVGDLAKHPLAHAVAATPRNLALMGAGSLALAGAAKISNSSDKGRLRQWR